MARDNAFGAEQYFDRAERLRRRSGNLPLDVCIKKIYIKMMMGKCAEAKPHFDPIWKRINESRNLNLDEKNYLKMYIEILANIALEYIKKENKNIGDYLFVERIDPSIIKIHNVSQKITKEFRLKSMLGANQI